MPYSVAVEDGIARVRFWGVLTRGELQAALDALEALEVEPGPSLNRLIDSSRVERRDVDWRDYADAVRQRKTLVLKNPVRAAILTLRAVDMGSARSFEMMHDHPQIALRLCASEEEALAWLRG
ncbi:MAG: hypothetical protein AB7O67_08220 [Vicinamibacterales bacterium]